MLQPIERGLVAYDDDGATSTVDDRHVPSDPVRSDDHHVRRHSRCSVVLLDVEATEERRLGRSQRRRIPSAVVVRPPTTIFSSSPAGRHSDSGGPPRRKPPRRGIRPPGLRRTEPSLDRQLSTAERRQLLGLRARQRHLQATRQEDDDEFRFRSPSGTSPSGRKRRAERHGLAAFGVGG